MTELYDQVYREYMERATDPVWKLAFQIYIGELVQEIATYHQGQIQAIADHAALKQLNVAKNAITKRYLANKIEEIRKTDKKDFKEGNWKREAGRFASYVGPHVEPRARMTSDGKLRHLGSQAQDYHQVVRDEIGRLSFERQSQSSSLMGLLAKPVELPVEVSDADHKADVLRIAATMTHDLENKTRDPKNKQRIQYLISHPDGFSRIETPVAGQLPTVDWNAGERVQYMTPVGPDNPVTVGGQVMNVGLVAGANSDQAAKMGSVAQDIKTTLNSTKWGEKLQSTANVLKVLSDNSPMAVQAHAVASLVNLVGPDATRAFRPKLLQLTYRYTGQEAPRDQWSDVAKAGRTKSTNGLEEPIPAFETRLGQELAKSIPTKAEYSASLQAGSTPPSKGYLLDRNGNVVSEAVGFSDDWYTPFNLRKLPKLAGGSYVRTRGYGGITPEDLRLAMRTGAKRVTVVSNNGTFTMEFEPRALHWGHRFGFGGGAMIRRYAKSLDAIQHGQIKDPTEGSATNLSLNAKGYQTAMTDLLVKYPYWITKPSESGIAFHRPASELPLRVREGDASDNLGYVKPLGINASGAMAGWMEAGHRELWADERSGKFAYDSHQQYQLMENQKLRVMRHLTSPGTATNTGNTGQKQTTGSGGSTGSTAQSAGAVSGQRAYPLEEKFTINQMDDILSDLRRYMRRADEKGVAPSDMKNYEYLSALHPLLVDADPSSYRQAQEYKDLRAKLANNPDVRRELADEIGDAYSGKITGIEDLLPRLHSEMRDDTQTDEEAGAAARAEELYNDADIPAFSAVDSSPNVKRYLNMTQIKADEGDAEAKKAIAQMNFYKNRLRHVEAAQRRNEQPQPLSERDANIFTSVNSQMVKILNHEREKTADTGDTGDDGSRTTVKNEYNLTRERFSQAMALDDEDAARDVISDIWEATGGGDDVMDVLQQAASAWNQTATRLTKMGQDRQASKATAIANHILKDADELGDSIAVERKMRRDND